jgi:hypothetical protein
MKKVLGKIKDGVAWLMKGRNGYDPLMKAEAIVIWCIAFVGFFFVLGQVKVVEIICLVLIIIVSGHICFRFFSKNLPKRQAENEWYAMWRYRRAVDEMRKRQEIAQTPYYRFFNCPQCKQRVRIPKGHGRICITCPKCHKEFIKRT